MRKIRSYCLHSWLASNKLFLHHFVHFILLGPKSTVLDDKTLGLIIQYCDRQNNNPINIHDLILQTFRNKLQYMAKGSFQIQSRLQTWKWGDYSGLFGWTSLITKILESGQIIFPARDRKDTIVEKSGRFEAWGGLLLEGHSSRNVGSLQEERPAGGKDLCWPSTREWRPQSYNHMELNSANNWNELRSGFAPRAFRNEYDSAITLISALRSFKQKTQLC